MNRILQGKWGLLLLWPSCFSCGAQQRDAEPLLAAEPSSVASEPSSAPDSPNELPAWAGACLAADEDDTHTALTKTDVASDYYRLARQELWCETGEGTSADIALLGIVIDFRGRPVEGAQVVVEGRGDDEVLTRGVSDERGLFELRPASDGNPDAVVVTAEGMSRHAYAVSLWQGVYMARLIRPISTSLIEETLSSDEEVDRLWTLLEVVGPRSTFDETEEEILFPHLGALRPHLRSLIDSGDFDEPDDRSFSPAHRAVRLLALWQDDADHELTNQWIEDNRYARRPSRRVAGSTIEEVCQRFADVHFEREGVGENRTFHHCSPATVDEGGSHGLLTFEVRYAHWGYSIILILRREAEQWQLAFELEGTRYHMRH